MKLRITHVTRFEYTQTVAFSPHVLLVRPRETATQRVLRHNLNLSPGAQISAGLDPYDNACHWVHFWDRSAELNIRSEAEVETLDHNPFEFILASHAVRAPFTYTPAESLALTPYFGLPQDSDAVRVRNWLSEHFIDRPAETVPFLTSLNSLVYYTLAYDAKAPAGRSAALVLEEGSGTSRDYAHALMALCRSLGFAARVVSGYFYSYPGDNRVSEGVMHMWTEVYLPGAGWRGIDATHGIFTTPSYVAVAHGPDGNSAYAVQGSYYSNGPALAKAMTRVLVDVL